MNQTWIKAEKHKEKVKQQEHSIPFIQKRTRNFLLVKLGASPMRVHQNYNNIPAQFQVQENFPAQGD